MKKNISTFLIFFLFTCHQFINAQNCGTPSGPLCVPAGTIIQPGLEPSDSLPCAIQGTAYDESLQLKMFAVFNTLGSTYTVDSIEFVKIDSLPCGLCWSTNKSNNRFAANEFGCIRIQGNTSDNTGQYKTYMTLKAWLNGNPGIPVTPTLVDAANIKLIVRVKSSSGNCVAVDTSSSANNLSTTPTLCSTSTQDLNNDISSLNLTPNPVTSKSVISFNSSKTEKYMLRITDITGKVRSEKEIQVSPGMNTQTISKNDLSAGIYFLSILKGTSSITKRFAVVE